MTFNEFIEYLENNLSSYETFCIKAEDYQLDKNKKRPPKKRWNDKKLDRAIISMWKSSMQVAYDKIKAEIGKPKFNGYETWIDFIEKNEMLEAINDSMSELEFE